jgi:hypothetical protein
MALRPKNTQAVEVHSFHVVVAGRLEFAGCRSESREGDVGTPLSGSRAARHKFGAKLRNQLLRVWE